jgi:hypothetical protein
MPFVTQLRRARAELERVASSAERRVPWIELLRRTNVSLAPLDLWRLRLERVRGKVGYDGIERISTQALFDELEIPQRDRSAGACRRLAKLMRDLGWTSVKARSLGQSGFRDQVRGYARDIKAARIVG